MVKKILHIIPDLGVGGAEKLVLDLCNNINKEKFEVKIVSLFKNNDTIYDIKAKNDGIEVIYLDKKKGMDLSIIYKLVKIFNRYKPDVINTHLYVMSYVLPAAILSRRKKIVHTVHNIAEKELRDQVKKIMRIAYKYFNVVPIAISESIKQSIINEYYIEADRIECIYNGIDTYKFTNQELMIDKITRFINVGRFTQQKNHRMLIEAFENVIKVNENVELILIGDGSLKNEVEKLAKEMKIYEKISFKGIISDVSRELKKAHVYVSSSSWEGLPITILEAMSCGLPIICTDVGGNKDIVKDNGILIESSNVKQLTDAMIKLSMDTKGLKFMAEKSADIAKKYDIRITSKEYEKLYYNL